MTTRLRLHRYRRVSTSDKGQDPRRQSIATDEWARREDAQIVGDTEDVGTSATFTNPFDRPKFVEACERARASACDGILAESEDRVCGQGSDELGWTRFELRRRYGLELYFATTPRSMHGTLGGNMAATASAEVRRERVATDRRRIREGIRNRREKGLPVGGQAQQKVSSELVDLVLAVAREHPSWGARRVAGEVSRRRGWTGLSDTPDQRRKRVSHETVRTILSPNGDDRQTEKVDRREERRQPETSPIDAVPVHPPAQGDASGRQAGGVPRE